MRTRPACVTHDGVSLPLPEWRVSGAPVPYPDALQTMNARAAVIAAGKAAELIWLLEHPPLYTAGTSADPAELFNPRGHPVHAAGRGGRYTYHGPGQRVVYVLLDLNVRGRDVRRYVHALEGWVIGTLGDLGIASHRAPGRVGIWTGEGAAESKIAAIGVRVSKWVTTHGLAINVAPDLTDFSGIVPCGIGDFGVTSIEALGGSADIAAVDAALGAGLTGFLDALSNPQVTA